MIQNPELLRGLQNAQNAPVQYFPMNTQAPVQNAESQYINQAITMPTEKVPTVDEVNQNYTGAKYQIFKDNFPTPSPREFDMQNRLYGLKTQYQNFQEQIDALDATKDADKIKTLRQDQKDIANSANVLRNAASNMGYDINGFGANNTFDESTQRIFLNRERGMAEFADMPSTAAQKREVYGRLLDQGVAPHLARAVAESYHDEFREKNINRLVEGIGAYGMNADGSLNQFGQMMMGKLYNESPYVYGNIANGFANPKDVFNVNANLAQATMNNDAAMQQKLVSLQSARDIAQMNEQGKMVRLGIEEQGKDRRQQVEEYGKNMRKVLGIEANSSVGKFNDDIKLGMQIYNGDEQKAWQFAVGKALKNGNGGNSRTNSANGVKNIFAMIDELIESGNRDQAGQLYAALSKQIEDSAGNFFKDYSPEDMATFNGLNRLYGDYLDVPTPLKGIDLNDPAAVAAVSKEEIEKAQKEQEHTFQVRRFGFMNGISDMNEAAAGYASSIKPRSQH